MNGFGQMIQLMTLIESRGRSLLEAQRVLLDVDWFWLSGVQTFGRMPSKVVIVH